MISRLSTAYNHGAVDVPGTVDYGRTNLSVFFIFPIADESIPRRGWIQGKFTQVRHDFWRTMTIGGLIFGLSRPHEKLWLDWSLIFDLSHLLRSISSSVSSPSSASPPSQSSSCSLCGCRSVFHFSLLLYFSNNYRMHITESFTVRIVSPRWNIRWLTCPKLLTKQSLAYKFSNFSSKCNTFSIVYPKIVLNFCRKWATNTTTWARTRTRDWGASRWEYFQYFWSLISFLSSPLQLAIKNNYLIFDLSEPVLVSWRKRGNGRCSTATTSTGNGRPISKLFEGEIVTKSETIWLSGTFCKILLIRAAQLRIRIFSMNAEHHSFYIHFPFFRFGDILWLEKKSPAARLPIASSGGRSEDSAGWRTSVDR